MTKTKLTDQTVLSYHFFCAKEVANETFTIEELCAATGWKKKTVGTYPSKKWKPYLTREGKQLRMTGIKNLTLGEYVRMMSQSDSVSNDPLRPDLALEVERLVVKAREAALHAIDGYNRPAAMFRTEGFLVMMVIAWRSLFHAIFEKQDIPYVYLTGDGTPRIIDGEEQAWDLRECLTQFFKHDCPAVRKNLEFVIGLRNRIEHRYVPVLDPRVAGECQALLLNFDAFLVKEFGDYYALRETLAVPLQTATMRPLSQIDAMRKFQGEQYEDLMEYIDCFRESLGDTYGDPEYSFRVYLVPKLGNHQTSSDVAFEFIKYDSSRPDEMATLHKQIALIKDRRIHVGNAGTYKPSQVARKVADRTGKCFNLHQHTLAWKMYAARKPGENPEGCKFEFCHFDEVHRDYVYTERWIEFLVGKLSEEQEYERLLSYKRNEE